MHQSHQSSNSRNDKFDWQENFTGNPTFWGGNATDVNFGRCVFAAEEPGKQTLVAVQG